MYLFFSFTPGLLFIIVPHFVFPAFQLEIVSYLYHAGHDPLAFFRLIPPF